MGYRRIRRMGLTSVLGKRIVMQTIKERRSIRKYKSTPITDDQLVTVLEAARWAPSWKNTQGWSFVIVRDAEVKERLAQTLPPTNPALQAIQQAPVVIVACAQLGKSGYSKGSLATDKGDWYMFDLALALQNLTLVAHALGLGTVHIGLFDARKAAEIIGVPEGVVVVELVPLGHPDEAPIAPRRRELKDFVFYDCYGQGETI